MHHGRLLNLGLLGYFKTELVLRRRSDSWSADIWEDTYRRNTLFRNSPFNISSDLSCPKEINQMGYRAEMTYSDIALNAVLFAVLFDLFILRTQMLTRGIFWLSYGLILPFQLLTNWWLTSRNIVLYSPDQIIGRRVAGAPLEDLLFGFSMILLTLAVWEFLQRRKES